MTSRSTTSLPAMPAGLFALASGIDIAFLTSAGSKDAAPLPVLLLIALVGVVTLAALIPACRGNRPALITAVTLRSISGLFAFVSFFAGAPVWVMVAEGVVIASTAVALVLMLIRRRAAVTVLAGLAVVIVGAALGGWPASPSRAAPARPVPRVGFETSNALTSNNWSGYEQTGGTYNSVSATWTVPSVTRSGSTTTDSSTWVGIDGKTKDVPLIQTGTEQGWDGNKRKPIDWAWYQVLPAQKFEQTKFHVAAGDNIYGSVSQINNTQWQIYLLDTNNGQTIDKVVNYTGPQSSADFIQEAPTNKHGNIVPIAKTSLVTFRNARVNGKGARLSIAQRVILLQSGKRVSTPSYPNREQTGFSVAPGATVPAEPETPLVQRHSDGSIWASTGQACRNGGCPGWIKLDDNGATTSVSAGAGSIYQLHRDGSIWEWTGGACNGNSCPGWLKLDANSGTSQISAGNGTVYQLHSDGGIWQSTGEPCADGACPGWLEMDDPGDGPAANQITAGSGTVFQLRGNGSIWQWTGQYCSALFSCPGWILIDVNPGTVRIRAGFRRLYQMHNDGKLYESTGLACTDGGCPGWAEIDGNKSTFTFVAGGYTVYQLHNDRTVWRSTGQPCTPDGTSCPGWDKLDDRPTVSDITASYATVFELRSDGSIWQSTGAVCSAPGQCNGWTLLDVNKATEQISASNGT